jgi:hypothetical protein
MSREALKPPTLSEGIAASQTTALFSSISYGVHNRNLPLAVAVHYSLRRTEIRCLKGSGKKLEEGGRISEIPNEQSS